MNVTNLQAFRLVARLGSIAAAARALGLDPSAVSRGVAALEREIGVRLFERTTRRQRLTEAGQVYLELVDPLVSGLDAARDVAVELVEKPRGKLRVTASSAYGQLVLAPLIGPFVARFPDVTLELLLTDELVDLVANDIDIAVRLGPRPSGDLIISRLRTITKRLVAAPDYLRRSPPILRPEDLLNHPRVVSPQVGRKFSWNFVRTEEQVSIPAEGRVATTNTMVLRRCVLDGVGVGVLADWLVDDLIAAGELSELLPDWSVAAGEPDSGVWFAYPSKLYLPLKSRAFIDHLRHAVA